MSNEGCFGCCSCVVPKVQAMTSPFTPRPNPLVSPPRIPPFSKTTRHQPPTHIISRLSHTARVCDKMLLNESVPGRADQSQPSACPSRASDYCDRVHKMLFPGPRLQGQVCMESKHPENTFVQPLPGFTCPAVSKWAISVPLIPAHSILGALPRLRPFKCRVSISIRVVTFSLF